MADVPRKSPLFSRHLPVVAVVLVGLVGSFLTYRETRRNERSDAQAEFVQVASVRHALTREILGRYEDALAGLRTMFTLEENVSRAEFVRATQRITERSANVRAFEWVPRVSAAERPAAETALSQSYGRPLFFTELDAGNELVRAKERLEYYPIAYIQPFEGNERALGYDIQTGPTRADLETARRTRQMTVSGLVKLVQETDNKPSLIMIWPVYRTVASAGRSESAGATDSAFLGFVEGILDIQAVLNRTRSAESDNVVDVLFVDGSATDPAARVLHYLPTSGTETSSATATENEFRQGAFQSHSIAIGGRDWQALYRPRAGWLEEKLTWAPLGRAGGVLLVTSLLAGLVHTLGRRANVIERMVADRTAELSESRRQLSSVMHALPGMAFRCRPGPALTVLFASEGALALTGHSPEALTSGRIRFRDLVHPDDLARVRETTRAGLAGKREFEIEFRICALEGTEKWVFSRSRGVYRADGTLDFLEGLAIDITAQKRSEADRIAMERKLLEGQKLESLGLLAGGIAHDFNNLLTGILGNASLLRLGLPPSEDTDPQLKSIENASLRAAELCRQMLAYAGKGRFVIEPTALGALVEGMLPLLKISIGPGVRVHFDLAADIPAVMADATQLRQIVMNLVINASDAIGSRAGDVHISTGVVVADTALLQSAIGGSELPPGSYVFLEVRDSGAGMSPETLKKIFDPFFSTKFAGRGLGLAAVLGIVRGHRGALKVDSTVGAGSVFRLLLPPATEEPVVISSTPTARPWRHTAHALIIEDDETVRVVAGEALRSYGLSTHLTPDGKAGLAAFSQDPSAFDLVLLDLVMPDMSGEETLTQLRAMRPDVTVLLMSGYSETDTLTRFEDPRSRLDFLHKPFSREMLKVKIRALLG